MKKKPLKIVCVADTHRQHWKMKIPGGDIFLFAGDAELDTFEALKDFNNWLGTLNFKYRVVIGGNHDLILPKYAMEEKEMFFTNAIYLENASIQIEGIKFWGSPYSKMFGNWSFMKHSDKLKHIWEYIPKNTDIVITHGPAFGILDVVGWKNQGCPELRKVIDEIKPRMHICGHLHSSHGKYTDNKTDYYNVSILNDYYKHTFEPTVIYYEN